MRGIYSSVTDIRRQVFTEVARMAYEGGDYSRVEELPYKILPGEVSKYRDSIFLERAIVGERLRLVPEFDNPHDSSAMAIYRGETKMGFVPGSENELPDLMFFYGHSDGFELRVLQVSPDKNPWEQVRVGLYVTDAR
mgnify:CR=1 FL=1